MRGGVPDRIGWLEGGPATLAMATMRGAGTS